MSAQPAPVVSHAPDLGHGGGWLSQWFANRIFNDRELDAGLFILMLGFWISNYSSEIPGWHKLFQVVHLEYLGGALGLVGLARLGAIIIRRPRISAYVAMASAFVFFFSFFLLVLTEWRLTMTPVSFFMGYHGIKSYVRISQGLRVPAAGPAGRAPAAHPPGPVE